MSSMHKVLGVLRAYTEFSEGQIMAGCTELWKSMWESAHVQVSRPGMVPRVRQGLGDMGHASLYLLSRSQQSRPSRLPLEKPALTPTIAPLDAMTSCLVPNECSLRKEMPKTAAAHCVRPPSSEDHRVTESLCHKRIAIDAAD